MSDQTLQAETNLIEKQAEAAIAQAELEETRREEIAEVIESTPVIEPETDEDDDIIWLREQLTRIESTLQQLLETLQNQQKELNQQLLQSMTDVFQTAVATLTALLTQQQQQTPPVETEPVSVEPVVTPESVEPVVEPPKRKVRLI